MAQSMQPKDTTTVTGKRKLDDAQQPVAKRQKRESTKATNQALHDAYHTKFPWTFFKFWQFLQSLNKDHPCDALQCVNLQMVGPFQFLDGQLSCLSPQQIITHYRYHFDLPEFQTIMIEHHHNHPYVHYGYWRDDPQCNPIGICCSNGTNQVIDKVQRTIHPQSVNLFAFLTNHLQSIPNDELAQALSSFIAQHKIALNDATKDVFKDRQSVVVCKTFHGFGLVVPVHNDVGYRDLGYSDAQLKRIFKRMYKTSLSKSKQLNSDEVEMLFSNICLADDEGDPGMGYELGIDLFYSYAMFEKHARRLLCNAYRLTNRNAFEVILNAHLNVRNKRKDGQCNELLNVQKWKYNEDDAKTNNTTNSVASHKKKKKQGTKITAFFATNNKKNQEEKEKEKESENKNKKNKMKPKPADTTFDDLSSDDE